jgi:hypothetical protein
VLVEVVSGVLLAVVSGGLVGAGVAVPVVLMVGIAWARLTASAGLTDMIRMETATSKDKVRFITTSDDPRRHARERQVRHLCAQRVNRMSSSGHSKRLKSGWEQMAL